MCSILYSYCIKKIMDYMRAKFRKLLIHTLLALHWDVYQEKAMQGEPTHA